MITKSRKGWIVTWQDKDLRDWLSYDALADYGITQDSDLDGRYNDIMLNRDVIAQMAKDLRGCHDRTTCRRIR